MATVAILKVFKMDFTLSPDQLQCLKVSFILDHFSVFHIFAVSMVTAAILKISDPNCTSVHGDCHYGTVLLMYVKSSPRTKLDKKCGRIIRNNNNISPLFP